MIIPSNGGGLMTKFVDSFSLGIVVVIVTAIVGVSILVIVSIAIY